MKKYRVFKKIIIYFIIFTSFFTTYVNANDKNEFDFNQVGMKIKITEGFKDTISLIENNEDNKKIKTEYIRNGILGDFINEEKNTEILVLAKTSSYYRDMPNLKNLSDEDVDKLKNEFIKSIEYDGKNEIKDSNIIRTNNYNCFIKISTEFNNENKKINIDIYYTIVNGRLITISFRSFDKKNIDIQNNIIENIRFYEVERPKFLSNEEKTNFIAGIIILLTFVLFFIIFFVRRKDKKILNKNIKDKEIRTFSKFGGLLMGLWMLLFYQIIIQISQISALLNSKNIGFYISLIITQDTIISLASIYLIYIILKRKKETPKKVIKTNIIVPGLLLIFTIIRSIYVLINPNGVEFKLYLKDEINMLLSNTIYSLLWIIYFYISKRVKIYYYLPVESFKEIIKKSKVYNKIKNRKRSKNEGKNN